MDDIKAIIDNVKKSLKKIRSDKYSIPKEMTTCISLVGFFITPLIMSAVTSCWWICLIYPVFGAFWLYFIGTSDE